MLDFWANAGTLLLPILLYTPVEGKRKNYCKNPLFVRCEAQAGVSGWRCGNKCISEDNWCNGVSRIAENCPNYENQNLSNCFIARFDRHVSIANGTARNEYLLLRAKLDWPIARNYCLSRGYELVTLDSKMEFLKLSKIFRDLTDFPLSTTTNKMSATDPLGQKCISRQWDYLKYWLGVNYNHKNERWESVDKNSTKLFTKAIGTLKEVTDTAEYTHKFFVSDSKIYAQAYKKHLKFPTKTDPTIVLCKKNRRVVNVSKKVKPVYCATGYQCQNSTKCIVGLLYQNGQFCDGTPDCPKGEDESSRFCEGFSVQVSDEIRTFHHFPYLRDALQITRFCSAHGWLLPTVASRLDIRVLFQLLRNSNDSAFTATSNGAVSSDSTILLGIRPNNSGKWSDGSKIDYSIFLQKDRKHINLASEDEYLALTPAGSLVIFFKGQRHPIVCQEGKANGGTTVASIFTIFLPMLCGVFLLYACW